ncbi:MAG: hypothetical protein Q7K26_04550 [bacterium]|nr:hypothetical protein [bacterium]
MIKTGVLMYTYNRTDDARINMEIIRNVWKKSELLKDVKIIHAFNGQKDWWPEKYLEDELLYLDNPGHFAGAELLINEGIKCFTEKYADTDYVVVLASDIWLIKPEYVAEIIKVMTKNNKYLATCPWGTLEKDNMWNIGMAIDFAIFDLKWSFQNHLFPIRYTEFFQKYHELFFYDDEIIYPERVLAVRFKQAILNSIKLPSENLLGKVADDHVYRMKEREPIHDEKKLFRIKNGRKMHWSNIGLISYHEPEPKQVLLKKAGLELGENGKRLVNSKDLSYYNEGVKKTVFVKGDKQTSYGD